MDVDRSKRFEKYAEKALHDLQEQDRIGRHRSNKRSVSQLRVNAAQMLESQQRLGFPPGPSLLRLVAYLLTGYPDTKSLPRSMREERNVQLSKAVQYTVDHPNASIREIARHANVDHKTISKWQGTPQWRVEMEAVGLSPEQLALKWWGIKI